MYKHVGGNLYKHVVGWVALGYGVDLRLQTFHLGHLGSPNTKEYPVVVRAHPGYIPWFPTWISVLRRIFRIFAACS